jgi:hypothetical protein
MNGRISRLKSILVRVLQPNPDFTEWKVGEVVACDLVYAQILVERETVEYTQNESTI